MIGGSGGGMPGLIAMSITRNSEYHPGEFTLNHAQGKPLKAIKKRVVGSLGNTQEPAFIFIQ